MHIQRRRNVQKSGTAHWRTIAFLPIPYLFSPFTPLFSFPPLEVGLLKPAVESGGALPQRGPGPKTNLVQFRDVRKPLVAIILSSHSEVHVSQ